jgi:hypothetical protein
MLARNQVVSGASTETSVAEAAAAPVPLNPQLTGPRTSEQHEGHGVHALNAMLHNEPGRLKNVRIDYCKLQ